MAPMVTEFQEKVRHVLTQQIALKSHAPTNQELADLLHCSTEDTEKALLALHESHSLLLHPHKVEPWVVHPFALYPASCWVQLLDGSNRGYWATCLYCGMGVAAALKSNADIVTRFGGERDECVVRVRDGAVVERDLVFHLSTPIRHWWDNVIHACASFQPFRSEDDVDEWCARHKLPKGAVVKLPQMWAFASAWYGEYISRPWRKRSTDEIEELLRAHDLVGPFWTLRESEG